MTKIISAFVSIHIVLMLSGCTLPAYKLLQDAGQPYKVVSSNNFKHLLAINSHSDINKPVIVFIEGDGRPWQRHNRVASKPTPDKPLLLEWFIAADFPAVYLGRPCYFELNDPQCSPYWYTHGRYSEPVVDSLVQVLRDNVAEKNLVLVGHSGGGTLAILMAEKLEHVQAVLTIAGNLQVNAWSEYHHYSKLQGSMDPMLRKTLPGHIRQIHVYSPFDKVIQEEWIKAYSKKQLNSGLIELPVHGHDYAWKEFYPVVKKVLSEISSGGAGAIIE
tara:strand:- start:4420 stop:5241 length:822 start_codon:yes stop_codon:yes gene_type:complete